jgi:hypothetical protein
MRHEQRRAVASNRRFEYLAYPYLRCVQRAALDQDDRASQPTGLTARRFIPTLLLDSLDRSSYEPHMATSRSKKQVQ